MTRSTPPDRPGAPRVSLVFTVLNEAASLPGLLDTIAAQTRQADEVIACDGGSRDGTPGLLRAERRFPLRLIEAPGANISRGRNLAIAAARGPVIACTDAGVRLDPRWLERLAAALGGLEPGGGPPAAWAAGFFLPDPQPGSAFEAAMSATVLPQLRDIDPVRFLPSSRSVAFLKSAWERVGGYPEWLDYCEDLVFDLALRRAFGPPSFTPEAVAHFRPRASLRSFARQYTLYARGDGKAGLWPRRHAIRYATYLAVLPALLAVALAAPAPVSLGGLTLLAAGAGLYLRAPYRRLASQWGALRPAARVKAILWVPVIRAAGDIAKMAGYPAGVAWRLRGGAGRSA
jgi:glycosyltransferase involved in cell wall biosynthesis